ncbi:thioesterase [Pontibacillus halophilus JSM 076056 = DSM 19796]|uniref:Thioesterase n=1 Tax=Pontibacillus halophilus JSM 076056 = DSM 19796 TaxID=1385510 RepID=A0A0A5GJ93_9BACI|nr:thioesterase family protein [Pontibacillus halophilus]KGX91293.1 thioesterase [Pontibacillus halophilus JSM 076056 = DSM 19796]
MHRHNLVVRFSETDMLGHVNNRNFFMYLEEARIRFFHDLELVAEEWNFILASVKCDFLKQAYFGQSLAIETYVTRIGNSSFHLHQHIKDQETDENIARGESVVIQYDFQTEKSKPMDESMRTSLEKYQMQKLKGGL